MFTFDEGRTVYELTDPAGSTYVMQTWSQQKDPSLEEDDLAGLGDRLHLNVGARNNLMTDRDIKDLASVDELRSNWAFSAGLGFNLFGGGQDDTAQGVQQAVAHALTPERLDELRERATAATMAKELAGETGVRLSREKSVEVAEATNLTAEEVACLLSASTLMKRAQIAERLAATLARLIPLERQSRNLDTSAESDSSFESLLDRILVTTAE